MFTSISSVVMISLIVASVGQDFGYHLRSVPVIGDNTFSPYSSSGESTRAVVKFIYPQDGLPTHLTYAFLNRNNRNPPKDLGDCYRHIHRATAVAQKGQEEVSFHEDILESPWLNVALAKAWRRSFYEDVLDKNLEGIIGNYDRAEIPTDSILERALLQRDLLQVFHVLHAAWSSEPIKEQKSKAEQAMQALSELLEEMTFNESDLLNLRSLRPSLINSEDYVTLNHFDLKEHYLPQVVLSEQAEWYPMCFSVDRNQHFRTYLGRSFIRIYWKSPGCSKEEFYDYWDDVYARFEDKNHVSSDVPDLPPRSETVLVRTFGVLLEDLTLADSGFPEEVIMRLFLTPTPRYNLETSDYRGTIQYQYKMRRRKLIDNPGSLGLVRIHDDSPSYHGFFADVPDLRNAYRAALTTMRYNCIDCHSPLLYGSKSVFSLGRKRVPTWEDQFKQSEFVKLTDHADRYEVRTAPFNKLRDLIGRPGVDGEDTEE